MKRVISLAVLGFAVLGCERDPAPPAPAASSSSSTPPASTAAASGTKPVLYNPGHYPIADGPRLPIEPGAGIGPIRFGATVETIERQMDRPCDYKDETSCRYVSRAVEFILKDGAVNEIRIHRLERPAAPKPRVYGVFNGMFDGGARFGMYREAVQETLGKPKKVVPVTEPNDNGTVEVHEYDHMRLEYDRIPNGNVVLGGVVLLAPETKK